MWAECVCGHHRSHHQWTGSQHAGCRLCAVCGKPDQQHVFVSHQFQRCDCNEYEESA